MSKERVSEPGQVSRRGFLRRTVEAAGLAVAPGYITEELLDRPLRLDYHELPFQVKEGSLYELDFGSKLKVRFLPLEHSFGPGWALHFEAFKPTIEQVVQSPDVHELWMESLADEMRNLAADFPAAVRPAVDAALKISHRDTLIDFFGSVERLSDERQNLGVDPVELVCPDLVGGSPWYFLASNKPLGAMGVVEGVAGVTGYYSAKSLLRNIKDDFRAGPGDRRRFLEMVAKSAAIGAAAVAARVNFSHFLQITSNRPIQNHFTEDTVRESWLAWGLKKYGEQLDANPTAEKRTIAYIHSVAHTEAIFKRLQSLQEHAREMNLYFSMFPKDIWARGVRKYVRQPDGTKQKANFQLYT